MGADCVHTSPDATLTSSAWVSSRNGRTLDRGNRMDAGTVRLVSLVDRDGRAFGKQASDCIRKVIMLSAATTMGRVP